MHMACYSMLMWSAESSRSRTSGCWLYVNVCVSRRHVVGISVRGMRSVVVMLGIWGGVKYLLNGLASASVLVLVLVSAVG